MTKNRVRLVGAALICATLSAPASAFADKSGQPVCQLFHILPGAGGTGYFFSWIPCIAGVFR